jgi:hypothetical protein
MSVVRAILEPSADGTLHLPLPPELRHARVRVEAILESVVNQPASRTAALAHIRTRQSARGHQPPSAQEIATRLTSERASWD